MGYFIIEYIVSFIVLLVIHAPWWAWLIYVVSALFWFVVKVLSDDEANGKTNDTAK